MCPGSIKIEFNILVSQSEADDFTFEIDPLYDQCCSYIIPEKTLQDVFLVCCTIYVLCIIKMGNITLFRLKNMLDSSSGKFIHPSIRNL